MKKVKKFIFSSFFLIMSVCAFAQVTEDSENSDEFDAFFDDATDIEISESSEDVLDSAENDDQELVYEDFDYLFEDSQDINLDNGEKPKVAESPKKETTVKKVTDAVSKVIKLSGHLTADVGYGAKNETYNPNATATSTTTTTTTTTEEDTFESEGYLDFENYLYFDATPSELFKIHGSFYTAFKTPYGSNSFSFDLKTIYLDYFLFDRIYISAGKKSESWGNTRIFNKSDYYGTSGYTKRNGPIYTNILTDASNHASVQIKIPWTYGNLNFIGMYDYTSKITSKKFKDHMSYAFSSDVVLWHTNINFFTRFYGNNEEDSVKKHPLFGLEAKKTIFGFDIYAQGIASVKDFSLLNKASEGYDFLVWTGGFYRLWSKSNFEFGINLEYQGVNQAAEITEGFYVYAPSEQYTHRLAIEAGSKFGPNKNHKVGLAWNYNLTEKKGQIALNYKIAGLFPYVQLENAAVWYYGSDLTQTDFKLLIALSFDANY